VNRQRSAPLPRARGGFVISRLSFNLKLPSGSTQTLIRSQLPSAPNTLYSTRPVSSRRWISGWLAGHSANRAPSPSIQPNG